MAECWQRREQAERPVSVDEQGGGGDSYSGQGGTMQSMKHAGRL